MVDVPHEYFFVDEAGDLTLLGRRGKGVIGTAGVSSYFMVGVAHVQDPAALADAIRSLRRELIDDPYFKSIPSMQVKEGKTAHAFHAKDDCPEVRMAVFKLLERQPITVRVGIRRKDVLVQLARNARDRRLGLDTHAIYDDLVALIFRAALPTAARAVIQFSRRGKSNRQEALERAIATAQRSFQPYTGTSGGLTQVISSVPSESAGLQAIDYYLWALQRLYERGDDRYFNFLRPHYRQIMDFDDDRSGLVYGTWYNAGNPLTREKIKPATG